MYFVQEIKYRQTLLNQKMLYQIAIGTTRNGDVEVTEKVSKLA